MHTPGPWTAMEYAINKNLIGIYGNSDTPVCNIFVTKYALDIANARLIAALPEIYDALRLWQQYEKDTHWVYSLEDEDYYDACLRRRLWLREEAGRLTDIALGKVSGQSND